MALRYRDTNGQFISRRQAAHISTREIISERYDDKGDQLNTQTGYTFSEQSFVDAISSEAVRLGVDLAFAEDAAEFTPDLTASEIAGEFFSEQPLEDLLELMEDFELDFDIEMDEDEYF